MKTIHFASRLVFFLFVAMAFLVAITQPVLGLVFAFLIPFWFFLADVVSAPIRSVHKVCRALPFPSLPVFSPRPPPAR
jgi:fumarate reductase subunit D